MLVPDDGKCSSSSVSFKIELTSAQTTGNLQLKAAIFRLQGFLEDGSPTFLHNLKDAIVDDESSRSLLETSLKIGFSGVKFTEDAFTVHMVSREQMFCIFTARAMQPVFERLTVSQVTSDDIDEGVSESKVDHAPHSRPEEDDETDVFEQVGIALRLCQMMCYDKETEEEDDDIDPDVWQMTARSLGLIDLLFCVLAERNATQTRTLAQHVSDMDSERECHASIYNTITALVHESRESENYVAKMADLKNYGTAINLLIRHAGGFEEAAGCASCLLNNNAALLQKFVTDATIKDFVSLIREQGPKPLFMNFFTSICSCQGRQVGMPSHTCLSSAVNQLKNVQSAVDSGQPRTLREEAFEDR